MKIVYGPLFAKLTKPLNGLLKKDGWRPLNDDEKKAVELLKVLACAHILVASCDERSALDGSRPCEQICDSSGMAYGGTLLQMLPSMEAFNVLGHCGRGYTTAQQAWPTLHQETFAHKEGREKITRPSDSCQLYVGQITGTLQGSLGPLTSTFDLYDGIRSSPQTDRNCEPSQGEARSWGTGPAEILRTETP